MILISQHTKMVSNRRCSPDIQIENEQETFIQHVTRVMHSQSPKKHRLVDLVVAMVAIPLLVLFSLMLQNNMRSDWLHNVDARWRILGLGLSLLFVSLVVCLYATHRLGLCIWAAHQNQEGSRNVERQRRLSHRMNNNNNNRPAPLTTSGSQLHLMVRTELPPSYNSVIRDHELPPPYMSIFIFDEKNKRLEEINDGPRFNAITPAGFNTRSIDLLGVHRPPSTG